MRFDNEQFSRCLNEKLFANHMKQIDLAQKLEIHPSTICRIVSGRKDAGLSHLATLLEWLGHKFEDYVRIA